MTDTRLISDQCLLVFNVPLEPYIEIFKNVKKGNFNFLIYISTLHTRLIFMCSIVFAWKNISLGLSHGLKSQQC